MRAGAAAATALLLVVLGAASCDSGGEPKPDPERDQTGIRSYEGRVIRGWLLALDRGDYDEAAYYFAPNALIDQGDPYRLPTASEARAFNASLPCRADLIALRRGSRTVLASFRLREGPGGPCSGVVRVRFRITNKGKIAEWHQRPEGPDSRTV
jgi:hypothetical protein